MGKKKEFTILINGERKTQHSYQYSYGSTKEIHISIGKGSARIHFFQNSKRSFDDICSFEDKLCVDAFYKVELLSLILYGKSLEIFNVHVSIDGESREVFSDKENPLVYSMIMGALDYPLPDRWKEKRLIEHLLSVPRSNLDGRHNALIALLMAKSRLFQSEKAMYLWISMNGFYNYLDMVAYEKQYINKPRKTDKQKQELLCLICGMKKLPEMIIDGKDYDTSKKILVRKIISLLRNASIIDDEKRKQILDSISELGLQLTEDDFPALMTVWFPYQIRCHYFHANTGMPVFLHRDDSLINALTLINLHLERWLEEELPIWLKSLDISEDNLLKFDRAFK
jgi:hypothetical protein